MAFTSNVVNVGASPIALNPNTATSVSIRNLGIGTIYVGTTGAGNQKFPVAGGASLGPLALTAGEQIFARSDEGTVQVAVLNN